MKMQPFLGVDQRNNHLMMDERAAMELRNVDLHPVGTVASRQGCRIIGEVDDAVTDPVLDMEILSKSNGDYYLYAATKNGLFRTETSGTLDFITAGARFTLATDPSGIVLERGRYVDDSNNTPDDLGQAIYLANGKDRPIVDSGGVGECINIPLAVYKDGGASGGDTIGYHGVPGGTGTTSDSTLEWRDWLTDPPSGFYLAGRGADDQMLAWGFADDPERVDYSEVARPWNWIRRDVDDYTVAAQPAVDGGYFYAGDGDGDPVVGVWKILDKWVVFKRNRTYVFGGNPGDGLYRQASYPVGCSSFKSIVQAGNDLLWWSDAGPVSLAAVQEYGDLGMSGMGSPVWSFAETVGYGTRAERIHALHDPINYRVIWFVPAYDTWPTDEAVVMYYDQPIRWSIYEGSACGTRCTTRADGGFGYGTHLAGGTDGWSRQLFVGTEDDAELADGSWSGDEIDCYWVGRWHDLESGEQRKRLMSMQLLVGDDGATNTNLYFAWDYASDVAAWKASTGVSRMYGSPGGYFDSAQFDIDLFDGTAAGARVYEVQGSGHHVRFKLTGEAPWTIDGWAMDLSMKGRR